MFGRGVPAALTSGGKLTVADLTVEERAGLYAADRWDGRTDERPDADGSPRRVPAR
jgi:hypothetical protein